MSRKAGKLVLVSDPTRPNSINVLAKRFGDGVPTRLSLQHCGIRPEFPAHFRQGFPARPSYQWPRDYRSTVHSRISTALQVTAIGLHRYKYSSLHLGETAEEYKPISPGDEDRNVLAVADFTFMVPPYNSLLDNDKLLSNLADYLTDSQREYHLSDFPYFYEGTSQDRLDILLGQPSLWNIGTEMRSGLGSYGLSSEIRTEEDLSRDTVFIGLYEDSIQVNQYLQAAGIQIDDALSVPFAQGPGPGRNGHCLTPQRPRPARTHNLGGYTRCSNRGC